MKTFSTLVSATFLAAILLTATAIPLQASESPDASLTRRDDASCVRYYGILANLWTVLIPDNDRFDGGGCGAGFLDNLRGRCGVITNWGGDYISGRDAQLTFKTTIGCSNEDVSDAIQAASYGTYQNLC